MTPGTAPKRARSGCRRAIRHRWPGMRTRSAIPTLGPSTPVEARPPLTGRGRGRHGRAPPARPGESPERVEAVATSQQPKGVDLGIGRQIGVCDRTVLRLRQAYQIPSGWSAWCFLPPRPGIGTTVPPRRVHRRRPVLALGSDPRYPSGPVHGDLDREPQPVQGAGAGSRGQPSARRALDRRSGRWGITQLPSVDRLRADLLAAGVSCVNQIRGQHQEGVRAWLSLFDLDDPEFDARSPARTGPGKPPTACTALRSHTHTTSRDPVSAPPSCSRGRPSLSKPTVGRQHLPVVASPVRFTNLGYRHRTLYQTACSGVGQSRDRLYVLGQAIPTPDLKHRSAVLVLALRPWRSRRVRTWRHACRRPGQSGTASSIRLLSAPAIAGAPVILPHAPAGRLWTSAHPGTRIGDRECRRGSRDHGAGRTPAGSGLRTSRPSPCPPRQFCGSERRTRGAPMAAQTSATRRPRCCRPPGSCRPPPATPRRGSGSTCRSRSLDQPLCGHRPSPTPLATLPRPWLKVISNYQGGSLGAGMRLLPTQGGSGDPVSNVWGSALSAHDADYCTGRMPTVTVFFEQAPALVTAAGMIKNNGVIAEARYRAHPLDQALGQSSGQPSPKDCSFSGWTKLNGSTGDQTEPHPVLDPGNPTPPETPRPLSQPTGSRPLSELQYRRLHTSGCLLRTRRSWMFDVDRCPAQGHVRGLGDRPGPVDGYK